jgi:POT family proton-dependent oligopeptide transporter
LVVTVAVIALIAIPVLPLVLYVSGGLDPVVNAWSGVAELVGVYGIAAVITGAVLLGSVIFLVAQPDKDRGPLAVILILAFIGNIFFWTAFEQAGSSLNVFAEKNTDRTLFGLLESPGFPAEYYQSVNPLAILVFAPVFAWLWLYLEKKNRDPSTPVKFALGLWLLGLAFLAMVFGSMQARGQSLAGPHWLLITYVIYTWGELCLSPVGLSMVTKLAPHRLQSLMMGLWFFTFALSNLLAGLVARFSTQFVPDEPGAEPELTFIIPGLPGFFLLLVIFPICAGALIFIISPWIKKMMHGIR